MKTLHYLIVQTDFPKWVIWWIGTFIFMGGLVAMIFFDATHLEYPLTFLMFPLLIFYFRELGKSWD